MANHDGKGYLFTTNFYKGANDDALLVPNNRYMEGDAAVQTGGAKVNKQEQTTTKQLATQKIHANNIHANPVFFGVAELCVDLVCVNFLLF